MHNSSGSGVYCRAMCCKKSPAVWHLVPRVGRHMVSVPYSFPGKPCAITRTRLVGRGSSRLDCFRTRTHVLISRRPLGSELPDAELRLQLSGALSGQLIQAAVLFAKCLGTTAAFLRHGIARRIPLFDPRALNRAQLPKRPLRALLLQVCYHPPVDPVYFLVTRAITVSRTFASPQGGGLRACGVASCCKRAENGN